MIRAQGVDQFIRCKHQDRRGLYTAGWESYFRVGIVLQGGNCTAGWELYCRVGIVLPKGQILDYYYRSRRYNQDVKRNLG